MYLVSPSHGVPGLTELLPHRAVEESMEEADNDLDVEHKHLLDCPERG